MTFKNAKHLKEVVQNIPMSCVSLETDSPYLTPEPFRGKKNNPEYLTYIVKKIAELKGINEEEVRKVTSCNVISKFDL